MCNFRTLILHVRGSGNKFLIISSRVILVYIFKGLKQAFLLKYCLATFYYPSETENSVFARNVACYFGVNSTWL